MKHLILICLLSIAGTQVVFSQSYDINRSEKNKNIAQQLRQNYIDWSVQLMEDVNTLVDLTEDQKDAIVYFNLTFANRMQILEDKGITGEEFKKHKKDIVSSTLSNYERVLSESQLEVLNAHKADLITAHSAE